MVTLSVCHAALSGTDCCHCESFSLASLRFFLFRKRLRPSCLHILFLPRTCEEETVGQRIWAAGDKRAHVGSMPACLVVTAGRAFPCICPSASAALTSVDGAEENPLDESVAAHLCLPTAIGWKVRASHLSKLCRATFALAGRWYEWPSLPLYAFPPIALLPQVLRRVREKWHKLLQIAPLSMNQPWVSELFQLLEAAPWPIPLRRDLLSHAMASTARVMGPACVAAQREPFDLPERVLSTIAEAKAPSTRRLYVLKWSVFSAWCQDRKLDPVTSDVSVVLSFLQEMLDKQRSSFTIKVYTAAIVAFHAHIAGRLVGRNSAVVQFLQGSRRITPRVLVQVHLRT